MIQLRCLLPELYVSHCPGHTEGSPELGSLRGLLSSFKGSPINKAWVEAAAAAAAASAAGQGDRRGFLALPGELASGLALAEEPPGRSCDDLLQWDG